MTKKKFIEMVAPIAVEQAKKHNNALFASVTIAQAAHESGWATSKKMVNANALYGVKVGKSAWKFGTAWKGAAYKTGTTEYYDGKNPTKIVDFFRQYENISDATEDYMDMLCHCKRYKNALNCKTPEESIRAIVNGGYATGPDYANKIIQLIKENDLTRFDKGVNITSEQAVDYKTLPILKRGSTGKSLWVKKIQTLLNNNGFNLAVDGCWGAETEMAVRMFQARNGLKVDAIVGPKTWQALYERG